MVDLLPCPFCGKSYPITGRGAGNRAKIMCSSCEATGPVGLEGERSAIAAWNTRTPDSTLQARLAEVEGALKLMKSAFCTPLARRAMGGHTEEQQIATLRTSEVLRALSQEKEG